MGSPMYQHIIGDKRASLSPAQRSRNGFWSTAGRRETVNFDELSSIVGPSTRKRSDFNSNAMCIGIDVRLGRSHPDVADAMEGCDPFEDRVRQRLLQIVAARRRKLLDLGAQEIIVPSAAWIVVRRDICVFQPNLDRDQQALRSAHLE